MDKKAKEEAEDSDEGSEGEGDKAQEGNAEKKKKKKKKNKKKNKNKLNQEDAVPVCEEIPLEEVMAETQTNERFRCLGGWPTPAKIKFPNNQFQAYPSN